MWVSLQPGCPLCAARTDGSCCAGSPPLPPPPATAGRGLRGGREVPVVAAPGRCHISLKVAAADKGPSWGRGAAPELDVSSAGGGTRGRGTLCSLGSRPPPRCHHYMRPPRQESMRRAGAEAPGWAELGTHPALWGGGGYSPCSPHTTFLGGHPAHSALRMAPSSEGPCRAGTAGGTLPPGCSHFGCRAPHPQGAAAPAPSWAWSTAVLVAPRGRSDPQMEDRGGAGTVAAPRAGCTGGDPGSRGAAVPAVVPGSALRELTRQHRSLGRQLTAGRGATEPSHLRVRCSARWAGPRRFGHPSGPARRGTPSPSQRCWGIWVPRCPCRGPACSHGAPSSDLALLPVPTGKGRSSRTGWGSSMGGWAGPALRCRAALPGCCCGGWAQTEAESFASLPENPFPSSRHPFQGPPEHSLTPSARCIPQRAQHWGRQRGSAGARGAAGKLPCQLSARARQTQPAQGCLFWLGATQGWHYIKPGGAWQVPVGGDGALAVMPGVEPWVLSHLGPPKCRCLEGCQRGDRTPHVSHPLCLPCSGCWRRGCSRRLCAALQIGHVGIPSPS